MSVQTQKETCPILSVPADLLCGGMIPDCRVLMMARTCKRMQETLQRGRCAVDIRVNKRVSRDARIARLVAPGINNIQMNFRIQRFECCVPLRYCQVRFSDFEELTLMDLRILKMNASQLTELHLLSVLFMFTFSLDMRVFEFTQQFLKSRHVPWLAHCICRFRRLETLNLSNNYFVFDSLEIVLDAVQTSSLSTLNLSTNSCEDDTKTIKLCRVIHANCMTLKSLNLSFMRLGNTAFHLLVHALSSCTFLESLDLSRNHLHYNLLTDVLNATAGCKMQSFNWSGNRLGLSGRFFLTNHILSNAVWKTTLREIKLASCDVLDEAERLCQALSACTRLQTLDVANNGLYASDVAEILKNPSITSLDVSNNYISDYGMQLVLDRSSTNKTLRHLNVQGNHMSMHTMRKFRRMRKSKKMRIQMPHECCACDICKSIGT
jgi:Leucine-rich repeat (LRR) protein